MTFFVLRCRRWLSANAALATERGSATIFVVGFALMLFACAGLAIDGGRAINARDKATDVAEQAARAGADQLDKRLLRNGGAVVLDQGAARARAGAFVASANYEVTPLTAVTTVNSVTVRVSTTSETALLGIVGINSIDVSGVATSSPAAGAAE